ncbi:MAG: hypothetical protein IT442_16345 [Phycisphaeraceae bacterium]|nr:hypothetical protein [Phycisphaeraceae bacterium]
MEHRHFNHQQSSRVAIDDVIARGKRADWEALRRALLADRALADKIRAVCQPQIVDPYAQRYHFWMHYVSERLA